MEIPAARWIAVLQAMLAKHERWAGATAGGGRAGRGKVLAWLGNQASWGSVVAMVDGQPLAGIYLQQPVDHGGESGSCV
jgi:hypothetical protein